MTPLRPRHRRAWLVASWLSVASAGALVTLPETAHADEGNDKLAKTRFDQGKAAYKRKRYEAARKALLDAYQLAPNDETTLYLGLASVKAKKYGDGARYLKKYLAATQGTSSAEHDEAEAALAEASKKLGTIEVLAPRGTEIYLDGDSDKIGIAPMEALLVEPGTHTVRGRTADGGSLAQELKVKAGETVSAKLGDPNANPQPLEDDKNEQAFAEPSKPPAKPSGPGLLAPPATMVPVVVALGVGVLGGVGVLVFGLSRNNAQAASDDIESQIRAEAARRGNGTGAGVCASSDADIVAHYGGACAQLQDNRDAVGSNALLTNVSIGVAGVGAVAALGLYLFLPKAGADRPPPKTGLAPTLHIDAVAPLRFDGRGQGIGLAGHF